MEVKFSADKITYGIHQEENYYMIGFSDNGDEPDQYVMVQRAVSFDEQDIELGMNSYYFEYSDQSNSGYGICKDVILKRDKAVFKLKENAINNIISIEITFENEELIENWNKFKNIFDKVFLTAN